MIKRTSKSEQGNIGLGRAIAYFVEAGYIVSIPLNDCQKYDLIVENGGILQRVQVKTSAFQQNKSSWTVQLRTTSANTKAYTARPFDKTSCDLLFILTDDMSMYCIPTKQINAVNSITVGNKYQEYRVDS